MPAWEAPEKNLAMAVLAAFEIGLMMRI